MSARTVAVTGAASGLGRAVVARVRSRGDVAIGVDRDGSDISADLGTASGRESAVDSILERSGGRLDGLVTAAGVGPYCEPQTVMAVNFFGTIDLLDGLFPALQGGDTSGAVSISSIGAFFEDSVDSELVAACLSQDEPKALERATTCDGTVAYVSAKRALIVATRQRATTWGSAGVRLNVVVPGNMATPMLDGVLEMPVAGEQTRNMPVPLGRVAPPEEVAAAATYLVSSDASYVHGAVLPVDGGTHAVIQPDPFSGGD